MTLNDGRFAQRLISEHAASSEAAIVDQTLHGCVHMYDGLMACSATVTRVLTLIGMVVCLP